MDLEIFLFHYLGFEDRIQLLESLNIKVQFQFNFSILFYTFSSHVICIWCYRLFHVGLVPKLSGWFYRYLGSNTWVLRCHCGLLPTSSSLSLWPASTMFIVSLNDWNNYNEIEVFIHPKNITLAHIFTNTDIFPKHFLILRISNTNLKLPGPRFPTPSCLVTPVTSL